MPRCCASGAPSSRSRAPTSPSPVRDRTRSGAPTCTTRCSTRCAPGTPRRSSPPSSGTSSRSVPGWPSTWLRSPDRRRPARELPMKPFAYPRPASLAAAFDLLDDAAPGDVRMIVGGTDLIVGLQNGKIAPRLVLDLKHLADLPAGITQVDGRLSISAPTSLTDIIADERVRAAFPALVEAAATVGSVQIRNRASLTGNICNASPGFDTATALLVHDAEIVLSSRAGDRRLPVADFVLGPRSTALRHGEIATAVELPLPAAPMGTKF